MKPSTQCWDSKPQPLEFESSSITTRPVPPPNNQLLCQGSIKAQTAALNKKIGSLAIFFEWGNPSRFFVSFWSFQTNITILQQINVKNVMSIQYTLPGFEPMTSQT